MTTVNEKNEQISAFIDGELTHEARDHIVSALCKDNELKSCLDRYQLISDSMRNQLPLGIKPDFASNVMAAIESEPTILAPATKLSHKPSIPSVLTRKAAGFAIAASVATLAVIGMQSQYGEDPQQVATTMPDNSEFVRMAKENPMTANVQPVITPRASSGYSTASTMVQSQSIPQMKPAQNFDWQLHQYIVNHSQYATGSGVHDIISSARIVSSSEQKITADQVK
jgi:negative regulator of sigma E activity